MTGVFKKSSWSAFGFTLMSRERASVLAQRDADYARIASFSDETKHRLIQALPESRAQLHQDVFALCHSGFKTGGFFVEFGATDGIGLSNTHLLETRFGWNGILAEPGRCWHEALHRNRRCAVDTACVWSVTGDRLTFHQHAEAPEYSTLAGFERAVLNQHVRTGETSSYEVDTISLTDLLVKHDAPRTIDYLSVDTEGSEFDILAAFDFARYDVRCITVEHNFTPARQGIRALLERHGFERRFVDLSKWDDWFVKTA